MTFGRGTIYAVMLYCLTTTVISSKDISDDLVKYVLEQSDPDVIPQTNLNEPVEVAVGLTLININEVDTFTKNAYMDAWVTLSWNSGITFDPSKFNNLTGVRVPRSKIWTPDVAIYNGELTFPENSPTEKAIIYQTGEVFWAPKTKIRVLCDATEKSVAVNTTCEIKLGSWTYSVQHLTLGNEPYIDVDVYFLPGSAFRVLGTSVKKERKIYPCCPEWYENILFTISFRKTR